jgi:hypothetical protein
MSATAPGQSTELLFVSDQYGNRVDVLAGLKGMDTDVCRRTASVTTSTATQPLLQSADFPQCGYREDKAQQPEYKTRASHVAPPLLIGTIAFDTRHKALRTALVGHPREVRFQFNWVSNREPAFRRARPPATAP